MKNEAKNKENSISETKCAGKIDNIDVCINNSGVDDQRRIIEINASNKIINRNRAYGAAIGVISKVAVKAFQSRGINNVAQPASV